MRSGAQLLDTRDSSEFAAAHLAGSVNIGLGGQYATWAGTLLDQSAPIVLVTDPGAETQSALRLGRIGFDRIEGFLEGGLASAKAEGSAPHIQATDRLSPQTAAGRMAEPDPPLVIDVRAPARARRQVDRRHDASSLNALRSGLSDVPRDRPLVVFCAGGYRSSIAASLLQRDGFTNVSELAGGIAAWEAAGLPLSGSGQSM